MIVWNILIFVLCYTINLEVLAYTQVHQSNSENNHANKPKIFKALHTNIEQTVILTTTTDSPNDKQVIYVTPAKDVSSASVSNPEQLISTGRAIYSQPISGLTPYFSNIYQNVNQYPVHRQQRPFNSVKYSPGFRDRFTPGEAVASSLLKKKNREQQQNGYINNLYRETLPAASSNAPIYTSNSNNLYAFPPNTDSKYPLPMQDTGSAIFSKNITSYLPPASGPLTPGETYDQTFMPSENKPAEEGKEMHMLPPASTEEQNLDIGVLPASAMDGENFDTSAHYKDSAQTNDDENTYATPPPGWVATGPSISEDHHYKSPITYEYPSFYAPHDDHPHIIYDDSPHHIIEAPLPTSPPAPPPEPRVKKYSYFYIGRKLWYIPLYFTVWFSFYVLWLIVKSIARHKINLPNHYTSRRSVPDMNEKPNTEILNKLTLKVLESIELFQNKQHI